MKFTLPIKSLAAAALLGLSASLNAQVLLNETFDTGVEFTGWNWTAGSFENPPTFGQAWNQGSSSDQYFTKAFASTSINTGDSLSITFLYNPNSVNISNVSVGLYSGTAATVDGWNQWAASGEPSNTWVGYSGNLAIGGGNHNIAEKAATGNHPYWNSSNLTTGTSPTLGNGTLRAARLTLARSGSNMNLTLSEGATVGSLSTVLSTTDSSALFSNYNVAAFYFTASGNGDMRYDNVLVEYSAVPEPSTVLLLGLGVAGVLVMRRRRQG